MAIKLGSNIPALTAGRLLGKANQELSKTFERLSSGLRINRASDDAAGLSVASKLNADARVFSQGMRNISDTISLFNIADGALDSLSQIVSRQQELAAQAANGVYSSSQRDALNTEFQALRDEYNRIIQYTRFNNFNLFDGSLDSLNTQAGYSSLSFSLGDQLPRAAASGLFDSAVSIGAAAQQSSSLAIGDFNNDGLTDLIGTASSTSMVVRLGNGNGTFTAGVSLGTGNKYSGTRVLVGDVNNDGLADIIIGEGYGGSVGVFLSNGNGTFKARVSYVSTGVRTGAIADFNADGNQDLAVNDQAGNFGILLGNGNGTFKAAVSYSSAPEQIYAYDFNADGKLDIAAVDGANSVRIALGNGNGTFIAPISYALSAAFSAPRELSVGDFNGDGLTDLVTANYNTNGVTIALGNGNGSFKLGTTYATTLPDNGTQLGVADLNGDGALDVVLDIGSVDAIAVLLGNGNGTLRSAATYAVGDRPRGLVIADFSGDGIKDIVTGDANSTTLSFLQGLTSSSLLEETMDISTQSGALSALTTLVTVQDRVISERSYVGSSLSRLEVALSNLSATRDNYLQAAARIMDADIASEVAHMLRLQILQQSAAAILAQANLSYQNVAKILQF